MAAPNSVSLAETSALLVGGGERAAAAARALRSLSLQPATRDAALALGAVPAVLPYLRRPAEPALKATLTQTFSNFCRRADGEAAVQLELVTPALPLLKDLLYDEDTDVLEAACTAVINLTHGPNNGVEAVQAVAGLTERLVTLMRHEASDVKKAALSAVANLLSGTTAQVTCCLDAGCLDPIISLLQSRDSALQQTAARAVGNIFAETQPGSSGTQQLLDKDVLSPLRNVLDNGEPECRVQTAQAMANLCRYGSVEQRWLVESRDVLRPYCALLAGSDDALAALVLAGLHALVQAAEKDDSASDSEDERKEKVLCLKLDEIGVPDLIQSTLQRLVNDEGVRRQAVELTTAINFYSREEDLVFEHGKKFSPTDIVEELKWCEPARRAVGARAARRMLARARGAAPARLETLGDVIVTAGVFTLLIAALDADDCSDLQLEATWTLANISYVEKHAKALARGGVIPKLVTLLSSASELSVRAAIALENIAGCGDFYKFAVLSNGTLRALVPLLRPETPLKLLRIYTRTCSVLCMNILREDMPLECLAPMLANFHAMLDIRDQRVLISTCVAVGNLIYDKDESIEAAQAVPGLAARLVGLLGHEEARVQGAALHAVGNMLRSEAQVARCLDAGCLEHLARLLRSTEPELLERAARAMLNINNTNSRSLMQRVLEKDIVTPLLNILAYGEPRCQVQAAKAIAKFCWACSVSQLRPCAAAILQRCIAVLDKIAGEPPAGADDAALDVTVAICVALRGLFCGNTRHLEASRAVPGLTARLVALLGHEDVRVLEEALVAVVNMLTWTDAQVQRCLDAGCLEHLARLLRSTEPRLVKLAAMATGNIINTNLHSHIERVLEKDIITPLLNILADGEPTCQVQAAKAISKLCSACLAPQLDRVVSSGVLQRCSAVLDRIAGEPPAGADHPALTVTVQICEAVRGILYGDTKHIEAVQVVPGLTERLVALLGHEDVRVQGAALGAVEKMLAENETQVARCLDGGCLEHLARLLRSTEPRLVELAVMATGNIMGTDSHSHIERVLNKDIVTPLLNILTDGEPECQVQAAETILKLCRACSVWQLDHFLSSGVLHSCGATLDRIAGEPLADADHPALVVTVNICESVRNILCIATKCIEAAQAVPGLTAHLVALLGHEEVRVQGAALGAVKNMLNGTEAQVARCLDAGCLEHLARLLRSTEPDLVESAAWATRNIFCTKSHSHIERVLETNIITSLLNILALGESKCQVQAAEAIAKLCWSCSVSQLRPCAAAILQRCSAVLDRIAGEPPAGADNSSTPITIDICEAVCGILYLDKGHIEAAQAVPGLTARLVALLGHEDVRVQGAALDAVVNMLSGSEAQVARCLDAGCLEHLARLLRSTEPRLLLREPHLLERAAIATYNIMSTNSHSLIERVLENDIVTPLLNILASGEPKCQVHAAKAISRLCNACSALQLGRVVSSGVLQRCSAVLDRIAGEPPAGADHPALTVTVEICGAVQGILYEHIEEHREAAQAVPGLTARLVALLGHEDVRVQGAALGAVVNMLSGSEAQVARCLDAGCLEHLARLLRSTEPELLERAAEATNNIINTNSHSLIERVLEKDIITPLLNILDSGELKCQVQAATVISNLGLVCSAPQRRRVVSSGVLQRCSAVLDRIAGEPPAGADHPALTVTVEICGAVRSLVYQDNDNREAAQAVPGLTARLVALLGHEDVRVQREALEAIGNMLAGTETQVARCLDAGCLEHLARLLRSTEPELLERAVKTIYNIFYKASNTLIERILQKDIITPLLNILADVEPKCQVLAAITIASFFNKSTAEQQAQVSRDKLQRCIEVLEGAEPEIGLKRLTQALSWLKNAVASRM